MTTKDTRYIESVGRRKTSIARVRITKDPKGVITVNGLPIAEYFPGGELQATVESPIKKTDGSYKVTVLVKGGGISSQAEAVRLGIARGIIEDKPDTRGTLKKEGFLKRDARAKKRRKFGLKKARKAPQWSKR